MKKLARNDNNDVVICEIGGTYGLGSAVKDDPRIHYSPVHDKEALMINGLEVMLSK